MLLAKKIKLGSSDYKFTFNNTYYKQILFVIDNHKIRIQLINCSFEISYTKSKLDIKPEKIRHHFFKRKGKVISLNEVLPHVGPSQKARHYHGELVKMNSQRLRCFKQDGIICQHCKLEGQYFVLEKNSRGQEASWQLNLYGVRNGQEIFLTKDHVLPKSLGGRDGMKNLQTLCYICNQKKGSNIENLFNIVPLLKTNGLSVCDFLKFNFV